MLRAARTLGIVWCTVMLGFTASQADVGRSPRAGIHGDDEFSQRIERLIQQLGASGYSLRQRAAGELRQLGPLALDQLLQAQLEENAEISLAARHLVGQLPLRWVRPDDPEIVGYILKDYQRQPVSERRARVRWLAALEDGIGILPVSRIVRYERSELLAKQAALQLMRLMDTDDSNQQEKLATAISDTIGTSQRGPTQWLRTFRRQLGEPGTTGAIWRRLVEEEVELLSKRGRTSPSIVEALLRWSADRAIEAADAEVARDLVSRLVDMQKGDSAKLLEMSHWLLDQEQWGLLDELVLQQLPEEIPGKPLFDYCAAEAAFKRQQPEVAEKLAEEAFGGATEVHAGPDAQERDWYRYQAAITLESRGLTDWSIREYRRLADTEIAYIALKERAVRRLAELLHDQKRDKEAAEVLSKLVENARKAVRLPRGDFEGDWGSVVSRMHYFHAEHYRRQADREKQMSHLRQGIEADPTDADVLIAMYRLPRADEAWRELTQEGIRRAVKVFETRLQRLRGSGVVANRYRIATELNQIAWLVGNTVGDYEKAVAQSRRSLELRPRLPGHLDTLGRAYFAVGDLENALKYQRRAVELEPYSQQIRNQLIEFEKAYSQAQGERDF